MMTMKNKTAARGVLGGLVACGVAGLLLSSPTASASSSSGADEYLAVTEAVAPNVLFLLDLSGDMDSTCDSTTGETCIEVAVDIIGQVVQHYDWANYGVIGTTDSASDNTFEQIIPLGTPYAEMSSGLTSITTHGSSVTSRNLGEALANVTATYLTLTATADQVDDDGDGYTADWAEGPIEYACQDTHVIVITSDRPEDDDYVPSSYRPDIATLYGYTDVECDASGLSTSDSQCYYDQVVWFLENDDARSDLSDTQNITVHTLGIDTSSDTTSDTLFDNASDLISGAGVYTSSDGDKDEMLASLLDIMADIREGFYAQSAPTISSAGDYLIYAYYEIDGSDPLAEGHVRAYEIDDDPTSATYGQVLYDGPSTYDGALWDGGTLLVSRIVTSAESNEEDRDGIGRRDIYTFFEDGVSAMYTESVNDKRQGFDLDFVTDVGADATALDLILDTTVDPSDPSCALDQTYDLNDDCAVDDQDLQALVDFARGLSSSTFRYLDTARGTWKLGDSPNAVPVMVDIDDDIYATNDVYRKFLQELRSSGYPSIVLLPANDGMLHAFRVEDDTSTADSEEGEELWAWIPGYLLYREHDAEWAGRLIDQMLYGRTFLFDGSPVVEDVWIDQNGDGVQDCNAVPGDCEWRRIVVVQQGQGGPVTLALDITDPTAPEFLWEQTDEDDPTAMGYTTGQPVVGNIYDSSSSGSPIDRYVVMWGSGRGVPYSTSTSYYEAAEANLYMWAASDDYWGTTTVGYQTVGAGTTARGDNHHPEASSFASSLSYDTDTHYEYAYISAALSAVDVDSDGDIDTLYFPVTTAYTPTDESGSGPGTASDPGSTWMYKACIDTTDPGDLDWIEFYDPVDDGGLLYRPEVYYAATTVWHPDGSLGVYWGSGSPYDRNSKRDGYFFAMKDSDPTSCASDSMTSLSACGASGVYSLEVGESLTSSPLAYAGVVYFTTWVPESDRCDGGSGRLYGLAYDDCSPGIDTDSSGAADSSDDDYVEYEGERLSGVAVTDQGTIMVGTSDGAGADLESIEAVTDPYAGTAVIGWMEIF